LLRTIGGGEPSPNFSKKKKVLTREAGPGEKGWGTYKGISKQDSQTDPVGGLEVRGMSWELRWGGFASPRRSGNGGGRSPSEAR